MVLTFQMSVIGSSLDAIKCFEKRNREEQQNWDLKSLGPLDKLDKLGESLFLFFFPVFLFLFFSFFFVSVV